MLANVLIRTLLLILAASVTAAATVAAPPAVHDDGQTLIIELARPSGPGNEAERNSRATQVRQRVANVLGIRADEVRQLQALPYLIAYHVSARARQLIVAIPDVKEVFPDRTNVAFLDQSLGVIGQPEAAANGATGRGTSVAVLDTGADFHQQDLGVCPAPGPTCRVIQALDAAPSDGTPDDASHHGTNVASIVARVAPQAGIIAIDVFDGDEVHDSDAIIALDWVMQHRGEYGIVAVNMSFGTRDYHAQSCPNSAYDAAFQDLTLNNIALVAAAGNEHVKSGLSSPACHPLAVSVGATTDQAQGPSTWSSCSEGALLFDRVPCFSNSGTGLDLLAPGHAITAGGVTMSGTSQAAPHVAGAVADLMSISPGMRATEAVARLRTFGTPVTDPANSVTVPRLALGAATNRPPVAVSDTGVAVEGGGGVFDVLANDTDEDHNNLSLVGSVAPPGCRSYIASSQLYAVCDMGQTGERRFRYAASDKFGATAAGELVVMVSPLRGLPARTVTQAPARISRLVPTPTGPGLVWIEGGVGGRRVVIDWLAPDGASTGNIYEIRHGQIINDDLSASSRGDRYSIAWSEQTGARTDAYVSNFVYPQLGSPYAASYASARSVTLPVLTSFNSTVLTSWQEPWNPTSIHAQLASSDPLGPPVGGLQEIVRLISPALVRTVTVSPSDYLMISSTGHSIVARRFNRSGTDQWGSSKTLRDNGFSIASFSTQLLSDGTIALAWSESQYQERRAIWFMRVSVAGNVVQSPVRLTQDRTASEPGDVQVVETGNGHMRICWVERWRDFAAIVSTEVDPSGQADQKLIEFWTEDLAGSWPFELQALALAEGKYLVSWSNQRESLQAMVRSAPH